MQIVRVFVVDDSPIWHVFVRRKFEEFPSALIIGMETNGIEAVRRAKELQPDLILLDINLQGLNGIEAARQIRKVSSNSAILFVSAESDPEIVRIAFSAGGKGYVFKHDAAQDLVAGMEAVLLGTNFISRSLAGYSDLT